MPFQIVKRRGSFWTKISKTPLFDDLEAAVEFASLYMSENPDYFALGLEAVEVRSASVAWVQ